jgi:hypothetical protein
MWKARRTLEEKARGELVLKRTSRVKAFEALIRPVFEGGHEGDVFRFQDSLQKELVGQRVPDEIVPREGERHLLYRSGRFRDMRDQPWERPPRALMGRFHQVSVTPRDISLYRANPRGGFERFLVCHIGEGRSISGVAINRKT